MPITSEIFDELAEMSMLSFSELEKQKMITGLNEMLEFLDQIEKSEIEEDSLPTQRKN